MSGYRKEWPCCGDETYTEAWEPERCPFCELNDAQDRIAELETELEAARAQQCEGRDSDESPIVWINPENIKRTMIAAPGETVEVSAYREGEFTAPLYTHPPKAQGVPEGWALQRREGHPKTINIYRSKDGAWCGGGVEGEAGKSGLRYEFLKALLSTTPPADKPEREWVKPEDQLPELTGWYCVALADPDDIGWSTSVSWVAFWNGDDFEECDPIEDGQPVTHWMPLPKPPAAPDMGGEK
ncbi:DUF551 domain-containing protein [uncultured Marinobacter sp.]|uniref:DUF551 domain-containing protein n=1 Tax=uncultured Marinobacter sp. TaxID=187379 RepID=UPI00258CAB51|nr:DUF551 domain-containing protein [uncultured Marinobacter sp.]